MQFRKVVARCLLFWWSNGWGKQNNELLFPELKAKQDAHNSSSSLKVMGVLLPWGTFKREAILTALSRKGPWHLSRTLATQAGMTNTWLYSEGLISVKE